MPVTEALKFYTYGDYLEWEEGVRCELIDGAVYDMAPAPSRRHQRILTELLGRIWSQLGDQTPCQVYAALFDVRLPEGNEADERIATVVQPDITVVCDSSKLDDKGCRGAPDWIVEIVSPSSVSMDYIRKLALYEKHGVREYWIVHPVDGIVMAFEMTGEGRYGRPRIYASEDQAEAGVVEGLVIDLKEVFAP